jgi:transcriptional regulator with XRE-family HTH domain
MNDHDRELQFNVRLGEKIRNLRREAGLVQAQLAQMVGLSRASVTNIEAGTQAPPPYRLALIADALRVHAADLMPMLGEVGELELPPRFADAFASVTAKANKQGRKGTPRGQG